MGAIASSDTPDWVHREKVHIDVDVMIAGMIGFIAIILLVSWFVIKGQISMVGQEEFLVLILSAGAIASIALMFRSIHFRPRLEVREAERRREHDEQVRLIAEAIILALDERDRRNKEG